MKSSQILSSLANHDEGDIQFFTEKRPKFRNNDQVLSQIACVVKNATLVKKLRYKGKYLNKPIAETRSKMENKTYQMITDNYWIEIENNPRSYEHFNKDAKHIFSINEKIFIFSNYMLSKKPYNPILLDFQIKQPELNISDLDFERAIIKRQLLCFQEMVTNMRVKKPVRSPALRSSSRRTFVS